MKILIIGANGYLGSEIYYLLKKNKKFQVQGSYNSTFNNNELMKINLFSIIDLKKIIAFNADVIIWSVSNPVNEIELTEFALTYILNTISSKVKFIYISTTIGMGKNQSEAIKPFIRNKDAYLYNYFNGKIIGESIVSKHLNHLIIRPGSIYGITSLGKYDNRSLELKKKFELNENYSRTSNMFMSYVHVIDLAIAIEEVLLKDIKGILNIAGKISISHFDFYKHLASLMEINTSFVKEDKLKMDIYHNLCSKKREISLKTIIREIK